MKISNFHVFNIKAEWILPTQTLMKWQYLILKFEKFIYPPIMRFS